jgi:hypothetical protein
MGSNAVYHPLGGACADRHARRVAGHDPGDDEDHDRQAKEYKYRINSTSNKES